MARAAGTFREPASPKPGAASARRRSCARLSEPDRAIDEAQWVIDRRPKMPYGAVALAHLEAARTWEKIGERDNAAAAYRAAIAAAPAGDPRRVRRAAEDGLARLR